MKEAKVTDPAQQQDRSRVWFGATVTLADEDDNERVVTLVGEDEADAGAGRINSIPHRPRDPGRGSRRPAARHASVRREGI